MYPPQRKKRGKSTKRTSIHFIFLVLASFSFSMICIALLLAAMAADVLSASPPAPPSGSSPPPRPIPPNPRPPPPPLPKYQYVIPATYPRLVYRPGDPFVGEPSVSVTLTEDPDFPHLSLYVQGAIGTDYKTVNLNVGCQPLVNQSSPWGPKGGFDPKKFNFNFNCRTGDNTLDATCDVPLNHVSFFQGKQNVCPGGNVFLGCDKNPNANATLWVALQALGTWKPWFVKEERKFEAWALGRCINGKQATLDSPVCDERGSMVQEFQVPIKCNGTSN